MILKLVHSKEIHVYDIKAHQSLDQVCSKIKELFKKVPAQFVLCYKNTDQVDTILTSNEQFNKLIEQIKGDVKIFKLFIKDKNDSSPIETKSQQKIETLPNQYSEDMTQQIKYSQLNEETTDKFTNLNELNQEIQKMPLLEENQEIIKIQGTAKQFETLDNDEQTQLDSKMYEREEPSQRELHVNVQECSDPQELRLSSQNPTQEKKENLNENFIIRQNSAENSGQNEPNEAPLEQKPQFKPSEQAIAPQIPQSAGDNQEPMVDEQIQDDFRSHQAKCDICNCFPICGARYKCVLCPNYDLCETCEQKYSHEHPLLKICYSFQTPIKIEVQIPEYQHSPKKSDILYEKVNLQELSGQERRERILSFSSEISELLGKDLNYCYEFVKTNEQYTKQTLIQMIIEGRTKLNNRGVQKKQQKPKQSIGAFFSNVKNFMLGSS